MTSPIDMATLAPGTTWEEIRTDVTYMRGVGSQFVTLIRYGELTRTRDGAMTRPSIDVTIEAPHRELGGVVMPARVSAASMSMTTPAAATDYANLILEACAIAPTLAMVDR